jgi:hypothetical protein
MNWQDAVVALAAALALFWLFARWRRRRRKSATACAQCPAAHPVPGVREAPRPTVLLSIGEPAPPAPQRHE